MKNAKLFMLSLVLFLGYYAIGSQHAQSPKASAENKNVKVTYGQPSKRGRVIFGDLVPFGEVWRTGANEATEITFKKDVTIDNKVIKAGTYTLFTIPEKGKWTIILNSKLKQWGAYDYNKIKDKDVLKTEVKVSAIAEQEKLVFAFEDNAKGTTLTISWDNVKVSLPISY